MIMIRKAVWMLAVLLLAVSAWAISSAQEKTMYSYTDENGTIVYTDRKPPGQDAEKTEIPKGPPMQGGNPYAAPEVSAPTAAQQQREEISQQRQLAREQQAELEAKCKAWREEVEHLEPNRRVFYQNEQGETVRMDDVKRADRVAELKETIAEYCP